MKQGLTEEFKAYSLKQKSEIPLNILDRYQFDG